MTHRALALLLLAASCTGVPPLDVPADAAPSDVVDASDATPDAPDTAPRHCPVGPHERVESTDGGCHYGCAVPWARCRSRLCDTNIDNDSENCGACGLDCVPNRCVGGACARW